VPPCQIVEKRGYDGGVALELRGGVADPQDPTHLIFKFVAAGSALSAQKMLYFQ